MLRGSRRRRGPGRRSGAGAARPAERPRPARSPSPRPRHRTRTDEGMDGRDVGRYRPRDPSSSPATGAVASVGQDPVGLVVTTFGATVHPRRLVAPASGVRGPRRSDQAIRRQPGRRPVPISVATRLAQVPSTSPPGASEAVSARRLVTCSNSSTRDRATSSRSRRVIRSSSGPRISRSWSMIAAARSARSISQRDRRRECEL